jgi:hypothetical protein
MQRNISIVRRDNKCRRRKTAMQKSLNPPNPEA